MLRTLLATSLIVATACGGKQNPELTASGPRLPPPRDVDPKARGAAYLMTLAAVIQPQWGQFLEDCRLRLGKAHPLNQPSLAATAELTIGRDGKVDVRIATGSGNGDFDTAVFDVLSDVSPLPAPPAELVSDDELVHLTWLFARDARQAGPATAQVVDVKLPLLAVVDKLIERKLLAKAIARVAATSDPDRGKAIDRVMVASLRDALYSSDGAARRAAVDAIARAKVQALATEVHTLAGPIADRDLRLVAIAASAQLGDRAVVPTLAADLPADLETRPKIALAKIEALVALGRGDVAVPAIKGELARGPTATGLAALALVSDPELAPKLAGWLGNSDPGARAAVCAALPAAIPDDLASAQRLIAKGLRDADATVRARCVDAAGRSRVPTDGPVMKRLQELARDRDSTVRARAIAALGLIKPDHKLRAIDDPASEVRAASVIGAGEATLRTLAEDKDPDVRAAALGALGDRGADLALRHVGDLSAAVRRTAVSLITDEAALIKLAADDSPDVATAALVRIAQLRGRAAIGDALLANLAAGPPPATRVRIALAWLLAH